MFFAFPYAFFKLLTLEQFHKNLCLQISEAHSFQSKLEHKHRASRNFVPKFHFLNPQTAFIVPKEFSFIFKSVFSYPPFSEGNLPSDKWSYKKPDISFSSTVFAGSYCSKSMKKKPTSHTHKSLFLKPNILVLANFIWTWLQSRSNQESSACEKKKKALENKI